MPSSSPWWRPDQFDRRAARLRTRAKIKQKVRDILLMRDFVEVETPVLQLSPGNETHIAAFVTDSIAPHGHNQRLYLHASPELACKKLLAAGLRRLFTLAPVFRNRERGCLHHPEFQMLEWYRTGASLDMLMEDCIFLLRGSAETAGVTRLSYRSAEADPFVEPEVLSVTAAFRYHAGIDLDAMLPNTPENQSRLADAARSLGLRVAADDTWSDLFSKILSTWVEPNLGRGQLTFLTRYPASEAALARLCPDDPRFAERFELYCCGVELANAFGELSDPAEQRRRFEAAEAERLRIYGETYPIDEDFLDALAVMPDAVGVALGFDRLVMLATGADKIEDVLWAPVVEGAP